MAMKKYFFELMTDVRKGWLDKAVQSLLWILSLGYGIVVELTRDLYQEHILSVYRAPKPVISVGNITTGGVGKTPIVIWLVKALSQRGLKTVVISRGYGSKNGPNDETRMFKEILPQELIVTGKNRRTSIKQALNQASVDIFVADDAFQHWPLSRDLDIVAIDALNPFGNGYLVPRGILREKKESLIRADIFILTKTDQVSNTRLICEELRQINSRALIAHSKHVPKQFRDVFTGKILELNSFLNQKVIGFCAIGDPSSFQWALQATGVILSSIFTFGDHHNYAEEDLKEMLELARKENMNILVTTHKDAVKIYNFKEALKGMTVLSLDIDLRIFQGQDEIIKRILSLRRS